ncbi:MAG: peptidoglycan editing factor PgeF [Terriglobia bacterium]
MLLGTLIPALCYIRNLGAQIFNMVSRDGLAWLESARLSELPWLVHAFSTRRGGSSQAPCAGLNLGFTASDRRERVEQNRRRFLSQLGGKEFEFASAHQVHSSHSFVVTRGRNGQLSYQLPGAEAFVPAAADPPAGDGLVTAEAGALLTIRIADCLPVLLVDAHRRVVAAVHAGWRGALARIIEKAVGDMRSAFGSDAEEIIAALGPSIRACCYEVGEEVVDAFHGGFSEAGSFFQKLRNRPEAATDRHSILFLSEYPPGHAPEHVPAARLDLTTVARHQLASAGLKSANILLADYCTACRTDLFFSHRQEGGCTGRQAAAIGIRKSGDRMIR